MLVWRMTRPVARILRSARWILILLSSLGILATIVALHRMDIPPRFPLSEAGRSAQRVLQQLDSNMCSNCTSTLESEKNLSAEMIEIVKDEARPIGKITEDIINARKTNGKILQLSTAVEEERAAQEMPSKEVEAAAAAAEIISPEEAMPEEMVPDQEVPAVVPQSKQEQQQDDGSHQQEHVQQQENLNQSIPSEDAVQQHHVQAQINSGDADQNQYASAKDVKPAAVSLLTAAVKKLDNNALANEVNNPHEKQSLRRPQANPISQGTKVKPASVVESKILPGNAAVHLNIPSQGGPNNVEVSQNKSSHKASVQVAPKQAVQSPKKSPAIKQEYENQAVVTRSLYPTGHRLAAKDLCPSQGQGLHLLVLVTTAPSHTKQREAVRGTWGHVALRKDVALAFVVGLSKSDVENDIVAKENAIYGDIIQGNFMDTYNNLTLKTISMLEWSYNYCGRTRFVLKTDDDMYINFPKLFSILEQSKNRHRSIMGKVANGWKPIRNTTSKYYISPGQFKDARYPNFNTGPAYVLTSDILGELFKASLNGIFFKLEDVYVTGMIASQLNIQHVHFPEFINRRVKLDTCEVNKAVSIHMVKTFEMYDLWKRLSDGLTKCN